mgnify:CR=1 FL=1
MRALRSPEGAPLVETLRRRYRYALIDEFQDTDEVQWSIFRLLFLESDDGHVLYAVGDPKQAIYSFRGADVHVYLDARRSIEKVVPLFENHRSTARLIAAVNLVLDQTARPPFFDGQGIVYDRPVVCGRPDLDAVDSRGESLAPVGLLEAIAPPERKLSADDFRTLLGRTIAAEVARLLDRSAGELLLQGGGTRTHLSARDVFVLTRTGFEGHAVAEHLRAAGVPYAFYKLDGLFGTREAEAVRDLLAGIADLQDRSARYRAWMTPFFDVPVDRLAGCAAAGAEHPLFARLLEWRRIADRKAYEDLFTRILDGSGLVRRLLLLDNGERALTNFLHLFEILRREAHRRHPDVHDLVRLLTSWIDGTRRPEGMDDDIQRLESDREAVQILTMHKAKGLEATVVFLYGGLSQPGGRDRSRDVRIQTFHDEGERRTFIGPPDAVTAATIAREDREEEQRLLYVALTRAKARLYLPLVRPGVLKRSVSGCYRVVNDRLLAIVGAGHSPDFEVRPCRLAPGAPPRPALADEAPVPTRAVPLDPFTEAAPFDDLRRAHAGPFLTSFTRMMREGPFAPAHEVQASETEVEIARDADDEPAAAAGKAFGTFVHEVIEHLPFETLGGPPSLETWSEHPAVRPLFDDAAARHGVDLAGRDLARRLVHSGLTLPLASGDLVLPGGLASCRPNRRELRFHFPFPAPPGAPASRGYIEGSIDFLFAHAGRAWLLDWKTNDLDAYDAASLAAVMAEDYLWQARLYSLALVRVLEIRTPADFAARFGGLLYVFLRGLRRTPAGLDGLHVLRPTWDDVGRWTEELARTPDPVRA